MVDAEKVLKGLEYCVKVLARKAREECPYWSELRCTTALEREARELIAELDESCKAHNKWISVKDRLPESSGDVLACFGDHHCMTVFHYSQKYKAFNAYDCCDDAEDNVNDMVTHWMPLPEKPKENAKNEPIERNTAVKQSEIIRCKDCKQNNQCSIQFKFADADNPGDWFCANGERGEALWRITTCMPEGSAFTPGS